jgi:hypothetical protein
MYEQTHLAVRVPDRRGPVKSPVEASPGPIAPNEPNLRRGRFSGVRNPTPDPWTPPSWAFVRNKANWGQGQTKDKCCADKELRQIERRSGFGKTKPIPRGKRWIRADKGPVPAAGPVVQTNPIRPQDGDRHRPAKSPTRVSLGPFAPNKPNFPVAEGQTGVPVVPETPYGVSTNQVMAPNEANLRVQR